MLRTGIGFVRCEPWEGNSVVVVKVEFGRGIEDDHGGSDDEDEEDCPNDDTNASNACSVY
jgi:hypothetical protein